MRNLRSLLSVVGVLALVLVLARCGNTESADQVHDLRMLGIRAEPPEQELFLSFQLPGGLLDAGLPFPTGDAGAGSRTLCFPLSALDGGLPGLDGGLPIDLDGGLPSYTVDGGVVCITLPGSGGSSGADGGVVDGGAGSGGFGGGVKQTQPVTLTALVADPVGNGRSIHYVWSTCAKQNKYQRCDPDAPGYQLIAEGDQPGGISSEVSATFTPSTDLLKQAVQLDPYRGFGGLPLPVQLRIEAGSEKVTGTKLVIFTARLGVAPVIPNTNPYLLGLKLNGADWGEADEPVLTGQGADGGDDLLPLYDAGAQEAYTRPTFDGKTVDFTEGFRFHWFATAGTFAQTPTGGGQRGFNPLAPPDDTHWRPRDFDDSQPMTVWIVVRDGRGGENWLVRKARFQK